MPFIQQDKTGKTIGCCLAIPEPANGVWLKVPDGDLRCITSITFIPNSVTMRQARLALLQSSLLSAVNQAVAAMPGIEGEAARIEWEFSAAVERNRPLVQSLVVALGLTEAQLDDLFTLAATL